MQNIHIVEPNKRKALFLMEWYPLSYKFISHHSLADALLNLHTSLIQRFNDSVRIRYGDYLPPTTTT